MTNFFQISAALNLLAEQISDRIVIISTKTRPLSGRSVWYTIDNVVLHLFGRSCWQGGSIGSGCKRRVGREDRRMIFLRAGVTCGWMVFLGKFAARSLTLDHSWGQIPHGAERKPAGVCAATSTQECFTSNGKCSQLLVKLSPRVYLSIRIFSSPPRHPCSALRTSVQCEITCVYQQGYQSWLDFHLVSLWLYNHLQQGQSLRTIHKPCWSMHYDDFYKLCWNEKKGFSKSFIYF